GLKAPTTMQFGSAAAGVSRAVEGRWIGYRCSRVADNYNSAADDSGLSAPMDGRVAAGPLATTCACSARHRWISSSDLSESSQFARTAIKPAGSRKATRRGRVRTLVSATTRTLGQKATLRSDVGSQSSVARYGRGASVGQSTHRAALDAS